MTGLTTLLPVYWSILYFQHTNDWTEQELLHRDRNLRPELERWLVERAAWKEKRFECSFMKCWI